MLTTQQAFPRAALNSLDTVVIHLALCFESFLRVRRVVALPHRDRRAPVMGTKVKLILWFFNPVPGLPTGAGPCTVPRACRDESSRAYALSSSWSQGMLVQITQPSGVHETLWEHQAGVSGCGKKTWTYEKVSPCGRNKTGKSKEASGKGQDL